MTEVSQPEGGGKAEKSFEDLVAEDETLLDDHGMKDSGPDLSASLPETIGGVLKFDRPSASFPGTSWKTSGLQQKKFDKAMKKRPEARHDYHGCTVDEAWSRLDSNLASDIERNRTLVEVIHGKGTGALKGKIRAWLKDCPQVLGFSEVNNNSGSVMVLLKQRADKK